VANKSILLLFQNVNSDLLLTSITQIIVVVLSAPKEQEGGAEGD
jgi:hypothetical protein